MSAKSAWPAARLGDYTSIKARIGWKGLQASEYRENGYIFLATPNIKGPHINFHDVNFISERRYIESPELMLEVSDVLLVKDGSTLGISNLVRTLPGPATVNGSIAILRCSDKLEPAFLHQLTKARAFQKLISDKKSGLGVPHLFQADLREFEIPLPRICEQRSIAEILDNLDTVIHETDAIIAKLNAVKQGLLHDLLTRGIDARGELRLPQAEAPHLYKQSPLGWIPKEWDTPVFGDTTEHVIDFRGRTPRKLGMDWGGGDILALSANNVQPGGIDVSREAYFGGERLYSKWMTNGDVHKGDVLLTMEAPLGNVAQIPDDARYILSQRVIALRFKPGMVLNDFAFWQMQSTEFQRAMIKRSTGSTATGIQRAELIKLHFKAPSVDEQLLIAQRLFSVELKLASELEALDKQRQEKSGLMDDLLTGCVRVTPLLAEAAQKGSA